MFDIARARIHQKHRTMKWPDGPPPPLPDRFHGRPLIDAARCPSDCRVCVDACPAQAISIESGKAPVVDLSRCLFCDDCASACPEKAITYDTDYRLASRSREDLIVTPEDALVRAEILGTELKKLLGRSLKLRVVSAGGCNACEADVNVLGTVGWDLGRFGIQYVASPRHADGLLITGPVTQNMKSALIDTYAAVPDPKIVIAVGACACSGGLFADHEEQSGGADAVLSVDLYIPGCPPHPLTILDGLLRFIGRVDD